MSADALREAAILVLVFGLLDKYMFDRGPSFAWTILVIAVSLLSFAIGGRAREISEDAMGPYTAIFGVLVFVIVVAGIGAVDILSSRRQARRQGGSEPRPLPSQPRAPAK
jgi:hypothetical protein